MTVCRADRILFWLVRNEFTKTYLFAVSAGFSRMAAVARPVVAKRVKLAKVVPELAIMAVFALRSKPMNPSSRPLFSPR